MDILAEKNNKERRANIRIPLLSSSIKYIHKGTQFENSIDHVSTTGVFIKTKDILPANSEIKIILDLPSDLGTISFDAVVIRTVWTVNRKKNLDSMGMGVKFFDLSVSYKKILDAYVIYLRNKQIIEVSKRIIEEFFGKEGPKKVF